MELKIEEVEDEREEKEEGEENGTVERKMNIDEKENGQHNTGQT